MPLDTSGLHDTLADIFAHSPASAADAAHAWAQAMETYAAGVIPPSTTVSTAVAALEPQLLAAFVSPAAPPLLEVALQAFAALVGTGMAPAFIAVPPPAPVGFAELGAPPFPETQAAAVAAWTTKIDAWMRTGSATPSLGGPAVPWT